jgi:hypothetical protein
MISDQTSVVADDIDTAAPFSSFVDHASDFVFLCNVTLDENSSIFPMLAVDLLVGIARAHVGDNDFGARVSKPQRRGTTYQQKGKTVSRWLRQWMALPVSLVPMPEPPPVMIA